MSLQYTPYRNALLGAQQQTAQAADLAPVPSIHMSPVVNPFIGPASDKQNLGFPVDSIHYWVNTSPDNPSGYEHAHNGMIN